MAPSLRITPSPIFILVDKGQDTGRAQVTYRSPDVEPVLWERTNGSRWQRRIISTFSGNYPIELQAGQVYEVLMYDREDVDPNVAIDDPAPPVARTAVAAIVKRTPADLLESEEHDAGGTYVSWYPRTGPNMTRAIMQVGRTEPQQDGDGVFQMANPLGTLTSDPTNLHQLVFVGEAILPGNDYWASLLLFTDEGDWQSLSIPFTTLLRKVEILLQEIHVINDGSPGHNRASFRLWVCEGDTFASACALSEREITDRPSPGEEYMEHLALSADCALPVKIGPSAVPKERRLVSVLTRGIAKSTLGEDDISGNFDPTNSFPDNPPLLESINGDAFLYFPTGLNETLEDAEFWSYANPLNNPGDNEFTYEVIGSYSVTYEAAP